MRASYIGFVLMALLVSCGVVENDTPLSQNDQGTIYIDYLGIVPVEGGTAAAFVLVNDSTEAIQFFGYSEDYPLYNAEALSDTGWTSLMWGWCGTGAEFYTVESNSRVEFLANKPTSSCTWRLVLDITHMDSVNFRRLYSENIFYEAPQN